MQRPALRELDDDGHLSAGTARTEWIAAPTFAPLIALDPLGPRVRVTVAEALLARVRRLVEPTREITGVEQREPDAASFAAAISASLWCM